MVKAGQAKERSVTSQEEEYVKLTFTEVQMELSQGNTVDSTAFQKMIDGNFGSGNATGTIGGGNYIITITRNGTNYKMGSSGKIETLDELPIDFEPGVLEKSGNIYTINSIEDLVAFSYNVNSGAELYEGKTVTLGRDLDFQDDNSYVDANSKYKKDENGYTPDSTSATTIKSFMTNKEGEGFIIIGNKGINEGSFKGNFDGKEKTLYNLYINASSSAGLFGYIESEIEICNISLKLCDIKGNAYTGGMIAFCNKKTVINNVYVNGKIESTRAVAGGIIGHTNTDIEITDSSNDASVKAPSGAGGITFGTSNSTANVIILNCHNTGKIEATVNQAGGIAGTDVKEIINCYNTGDVISKSVAGGISATGTVIANCYNKGIIESTESQAGGINGNLARTITNCYNDGEVKGKFQAGGISGSNATITYCYNSGNIVTSSAYPAGGISANSSTITNSHNSGVINGENSSLLGEIIGTGNVDNTNDYLIKSSNATNISNAVGKTQSEMDEIMSVQNFVNLMNSYVEENNLDSTKTKLKTWKVENGMPVFAE